MSYRQQWVFLSLLLLVHSASAAFSSILKSRTNRPRKSVLSATSSSDVYSVLSNAQVICPQTGRNCMAFDDDNMIGKSFFPFLDDLKKKCLVVVMPQLGDFDSAEYAEMLNYVLPDLKAANICLRIIGIGNAKSAQMFSLHTGIPLEYIRVDPTASVHRALELHRGPDWDIPSWTPRGALDRFAKEVGAPLEDSVDVARGWLNYMAMCAGISAPGTLQEILRGYFGDKTAPERLFPDQVVRAGPIVIKGVKDVKIGPIEYQSLWKNEEGYLRPAELATVRLRHMVEVLTKFDEYVPDQSLLDWRGATFLLDSKSVRSNGPPIYEHRDQGVLNYSETMPRPLSFLSEMIGFEKSRNPMGMKDPEAAYEKS